MLLFLRELGIEAQGPVKFGITNLEEPSLNISDEKDVFLEVQAVDVFVKSDHEPPPFHENHLYIDLLGPSSMSFTLAT